MGGMGKGVVPHRRAARVNRTRPPATAAAPADARTRAASRGHATPLAEGPVPVLGAVTEGSVPGGTDARSRVEAKVSIPFGWSAL